MSDGNKTTDDAESSSDSTFSALSDGEEHDKKDAVDNYLRCKMCREILQQPRSLPCQHTFCHECLSSYIIVTAVTCPECNRNALVPDPNKPLRKLAAQFKPLPHIQIMLDARVRRHESNQKKSTITGVGGGTVKGSVVVGNLNITYNQRYHRKTPEGDDIKGMPSFKTKKEVINNHLYHRKTPEDQDFPAFSLTDDDIKGISIKTKKEGCDLFPGPVADYLIKNHKNIVENFENLEGWSGGIVLSAQSLMQVIGKPPEQATGVIADVCVLSDTKPVLILTFQGDLRNKLGNYNHQLARHIEKFVVKKTGIKISTVHDVIEKGASLKTFKETLQKLERLADMLSFSQAPEMTPERYNIILRCLIELFTGSHVGIPSDPGPSAHDGRSVPQDAVDNILRCNICQDILVQPRSLPCQHTFCHECLSSYIGENRRFTRMKAVTCSVCNKDARVPDSSKPLREWAAQFQPLLHIQKLLDARVQVSAEIVREGGAGDQSGDKDLMQRQDITPHHTSETVRERGAGDQSGDKDLMQRQDITPHHTAEDVDKSSLSEERSEIKQHGEGGPQVSVKIDKSDNFKDNKLHEACIEGNLSMVEHIISRDIVDKESKGVFKRTPLMCSALFGHIAVFDFLVSKGCDVKVVDEYNDNILHMACLGGHLDMVKHVLSLDSIDKESRGMYQSTPLMFAAELGHIAVFDFLVSKGCDVKVVDEDNDNILHTACLGGHLDMVKHVLSLGCIDQESRGQYKRTPLMRAAELGHIAVFDFLVSKGCDVRVVDEDNDNILHTACLGGHLDMVQHVLSLGCIDQESRGMFKSTPLICAAEKGHIAVFDFLVSKGCDVRVVDENNDNILHVACLGGHLDMVQHVLTLNCVNKDGKNRYGNTPLMIAVQKGHKDVVDLLVRSGCAV